MIELVSLCVCSACLSCICCLITGGLCMIPAAVHLRNKILEKNSSAFDDEQKCLRNCERVSSEIYQNNYNNVEEDYSDIDSKSCRISKICLRNNKKKDGSKKYTKKNAKVDYVQCVDGKFCESATGTTAAEIVDEGLSKDRSSTIDKKNDSKTSKAKTKSKPKSKRWLFCFNSLKSDVDLPNEECSLRLENGEAEAKEVENEEEEGDEEEEEKTGESKYAVFKKTKKPQRDRNDSQTYIAYFKSCSCSDQLKERSKKRGKNKKRKSAETKVQTTASIRCPDGNNSQKRKSKTSRKYNKKSKKNCCCCKLVTDNKNANDQRSRELVTNEMKCNCGGREKESSKSRCCGCSKRMWQNEINKT